jgi:hypothetical protein
MAVDLIVRGPDDGLTPSQAALTSGALRGGASAALRELFLATRETETPLSMASPFVAAGAAFAIGREGAGSPALLAFAAITAGLCVSAALI